MRFIGNKRNLLDFIFKTVYATKNTGCTFCDFFSGTANVAKFFKTKGYKIISSDNLYFSYVLQKAYIENNYNPNFNTLIKKLKLKDIELFRSPLNLVCHYLNNLKGIKGFIYKNYTEDGTKNKKIKRKFFISQNGMNIDKIRTTIENWYSEKLINEEEYFVLLACLIESVPFYANVSGVYAAFLKTYDPRALKKLKLRTIPIYKSNKKHKVYHGDSMKLLDNLKIDILYIDPPYNNRQYGPNYHLLETIAKYDNPEIKGVSGMRNYEDQKSEFCNKEKALGALDQIAKKAKYKYLLLSYNSEGIMPKDQIISILNKYGEVDLNELDYRRFKSNNNGDSNHKKTIKEQIYVLKSN